MNFQMPKRFCPEPWADYHDDTTMTETALLHFLHSVIQHATAVAVVVSDSVEQERHTRAVLLPLLNGLYEELQSAENLLNAWDAAPRTGILWPVPPGTGTDDA